MSITPEYLNDTSKNKVYGFDNINELKKRLSEIKTEEFSTRYNILINLQDIDKYPLILEQMVKILSKEITTFNSIQKIIHDIHNIKETNYGFNTLIDSVVEKKIQKYCYEISELEKIISDNNKFIIDIYMSMKR
jgi:ABC-type uncharacterized transport system involved in gliding motility auxiliary subunit